MALMKIYFPPCERCLILQLSILCLNLSFKAWKDDLFFLPTKFGSPKCRSGSVDLRTLRMLEADVLTPSCVFELKNTVDFS